MNADESPGGEGGEDRMLFPPGLAARALAAMAAERL